jgi:hypothetical protein
VPALLTAPEQCVNFTGLVYCRGSAIALKGNHVLLIFKEFSDVIKTNFDAQLATASAMAMNAFDSAEKFSEVNMNAAKSAMEQSTAAGKQLTSVKGQQEVLSLIASHTQPNVEEILNYGRRGKARQRANREFAHC